MYHTIKDFLSDWQYESSSTIKIFQNLSDESLQKTFSEEVRKIARLVWHITVTPNEMLSKAGLQIAGPAEHSKAPLTAKEIVDGYKTAANSVSDLIQKNWDDKSLNDMVAMYGQQWEKGKILSVLVHHQIHHRGQLTVLMRLSGLKVPGIYGPSREEWAAMGMEAME